MKKILSESLLKEELTPEQWESFQKTWQEDGIEQALMNLPDMGEEEIHTCANSFIKLLRTENGLSQTDLANILGLSQREYWRYEQKGYSINIQKLAQIAIFYNVSLDCISGYHLKMKPFYEEQEKTYVNGYNLAEFKEAKAKGEKYHPH